MKSASTDKSTIRDNIELIFWILKSVCVMHRYDLINNMLAIYLFSTSKIIPVASFESTFL